MAITSRLAIGSPYHNSHSCAMRTFGRAPWPSKGFALSMKRMARQSLDSLIQVTSSHSGGRFGMLGEPVPLLLLKLQYNTLPIHATVVSRKARRSTNSEQLAHTMLTLFNSPARFYVSVVMKMILSHLMVDYEFKLADSTARPFLTFGNTRLPSPFMTILVRKRTVHGDGERLPRRYA